MSPESRGSEGQTTDMKRTLQMYKFFTSSLIIGILVATGCSSFAEQSATEVSEDLAVADGGGTEKATEERSRDLEQSAEIFEFSSYTEVQEWFAHLNYTPEAWQARIREVPRLYLTNIPPRWKDSVSKEVTTLLKKRLFFRSMAPLVLRTNELVLTDRQRAESLIAQMNTSKPLASEDSAWLVRLASRYGVLKTPEEKATIGDLYQESQDELLRRVDIVPPSLAMSQCVEESGWGTSRFAAEGNALFGQWIYSETGIKPENQRPALGDHRIAAFETPLKAVMAYAHNLNTHAAYAELRAKRAEMRRNNERLSGRELAKTLTRYSERGQAYIDTLHSIMRVNRLDPADDAYLSDGPTYFLVPAGEGSK